MQYLGALGYSDSLPISNLLPRVQANQKWSSQEGWQEIELHDNSQDEDSEDTASQGEASRGFARVLTSGEVGAFHKNVEDYLEGNPIEADGELLQLNSDLNALLRAALWEDKFDEIWSKDAPTGISFTSEQEKSLVEADIPRVLAGAEPSNEYSKSFCNELMRWCEAYFQLYCGKDFADKNYPQWFTLSYRQE